MKKCESKPSYPCLHAPCLETQGVKCCAECQNYAVCATKCPRAGEKR